MTDDTDGWTFELRYMGANLRDPSRRYQAYRSDDMFGDGGRVLMSRIGEDGFTEVAYATLSPTEAREVVIAGMPVVRLRRLANGTIAGEWIPPPPPPPVSPPPTAAPIRRPAARRAEPAAPGPLPVIKACTACASFRPYVRVSERFALELAATATEETVASALNELVKEEERGKGEEARLLADLYRRGAARWPGPPSFFAHCAAHARDDRDPAAFIAQIRNADQRCRPVRRSDGESYTDAPTDFTPAPVDLHACATCAHRVPAPGPGADARELREILGAAIRADTLGAGYGKTGGTEVASKYADTARRNAATARARELREAFARRAAASHTSMAPRYLDHCGLKSDAGGGTYRVCSVENANDCCPDWTPSE
jgi:hypothetical protein